MNSQDEISLLTKRADLFFEFIFSKGGSNALLRELQSGIHATSEVRDLKRLKQFNSEIDLWARNLPTEQDTIEFWKILKQELGEDYSAKYSKQIQTIKKRGIRSEFEYQRLEDHINDLCQKGNSDLEVEELNQILAEFEANNPKS